MSHRTLELAVAHSEHEGFSNVAGMTENSGGNAITEFGYQFRTAGVIEVRVVALGGLVGRTGGSRGGAERLQRANTRRERLSCLLLVAQEAPDWCKRTLRG